MPSQRSKRRTLITLIIAVAAVLAMLGLVRAQGASKPKPTGSIAANPWHDDFRHGKGEPLPAPAQKLWRSSLSGRACAFFGIDSIQARSIKPEAWRYCAQCHPRRKDLVLQTWIDQAAEGLRAPCSAGI